MSSGNWRQQPTQQELLTALNAYSDVDIDNIPEQRRVLEKNQKALLHERAILLIKKRILDFRKAPSGNEGRIFYHEDRLRLLEDARSYGIPIAIERLQQRRTTEAVNAVFDYLDKTSE